MRSLRVELARQSGSALRDPPPVALRSWCFQRNRGAGQLGRARSFELSASGPARPPAKAPYSCSSRPPLRPPPARPNYFARCPRRPEESAIGRGSEIALRACHPWQTGVAKSRFARGALAPRRRGQSEQASSFQRRRSRSRRSGRETGAMFLSRAGAGDRVRAGGRRLLFIGNPRRATRARGAAGVCGPWRRPGTRDIARSFG